MDGDTGAQWGEDPGWRPSLRALNPLFRFRHRGTLRHPISLLRLLYLTFINALVLYGFVLVVSGPFRSKNNGLGWLIGIGAIALVNLVVVRMVERPLSCESNAVLVGSYRTRFFLRIAFAESTVLLGFVAAFAIRGSWIYFFGALCSLPAFLRAAPSRAAFTRDQDELTGRGCTRSLLEAFRGLPPKRE